MPAVLVVEDERDIRELLRRYLERAGLAVVTTGSGAEALGIVDASPPDLVLLDLGLPDVDGTEVLRLVHRRVPVLVLTARAAVADRIEGLQLGADDYVVKPFSPTEVVLRVQAILARSGGPVVQASTRHSFGNGLLAVDEERHAVELESQAVDLTATEFGILTALASVPGRVFSRYELVNRVRGYEFAGYERTIDSHVKNLRRKLDPHGAAIVETVVGVGYRLGLVRDA